MDCSPPGSSVHGILQARILGWVAIPFSRGSSPPRSSHISYDFFIEADSLPTESVGKSSRSGRCVWKWPNITVSWEPNPVTGRLLPLLFRLSAMSDSFMTPMDCSLPGSSIYGIFQARLPQWVTISSSRGSSRLRDRTCASISRSPTLQVDSLWLSPLVSPTVRLGPQNMAKQKCGLNSICSWVFPNCCQLSGKLQWPLEGTFE